MGNHEGCEAVTINKLIGQLHQGNTGLRIQRRSMLIQKQKLWALERCHEQTQGLSLPARKKFNRCIQMFVQTITDFLNRRLKLFPVAVESTGYQATLFASEFGNEKIFRHCHPRSRSHLRILKDTGQVLGPLFW